MADSAKSVSTSEEKIAALETRISALEYELDAARAEIERYHSAIQNTPDVLLSIDRHGKILIANEAPTGNTAANIIGMNIFSLIQSDDHQEKLRYALEHVFRTGETASYEHIDSEGEWHATRVSPIHKDGVIVSATVIGTNISAYKKLEAERARLLAEERKQRELAEALRDAGMAFSSTLDLDTILHTLLEQIARVVPYDAANVMVVEGNIARIAQARGYDRFGDEVAADVEGLTFDISETTNLRTMVETERPLIIPNTDTYPYWVHVRPKNTVRSWAGAPIIVQGEVVAFFSLDKAEPDFYHPGDAERLSAFAGQAAVAIKNARLFDAVRSALSKTEALQYVSQQLIAQNTLTAVLQSVVDGIAESLPAHTVILSAPNLEHRDTAYFVKGGPGAQEIDAVSFEHLKTGLTGWLQNTRTSILSHRQLSAFLNPPHQLPTTPPDEPSHVIVAPLRYQNTILGTLTAINQPGNPSYTRADVELMEAMANQAAIAIQNVYWHEESRKQARLVQQILDSVSLGILLLDKDHRIKVANPTASAFLRVLGTSDPDSGKLQALGKLPLLHILEVTSYGTWHEITSLTPPERIFTVSAHSVEAEGWVIVLNDVTDVRAQQRRTQQQEHLAAIGQMAAGFAHDFNNILTSMIGFADLVSRRASTPDAAKNQLRHIVEQGQRAAELIAQILDFSRQSTNQTKSTTVSPFLDTAADFVRQAMPPSVVVSLTMDEAVKSAHILLDVERIRQVLLNLARNARDAMPDGGTLTLSAYRLHLQPNEPAPYPTMPPGSWIAIAIADSGVGIPEDVVPHVFEPFFTTKDVGAGTGLGLSQAYGIMKQHGGYITISSVVEEGTLVTLFFPEELISKPPLETRPPLPHKHGASVLLVEDNLKALKNGASMLETLGYTPLTAQDGYNALAQFDAHEADIELVIMDSSMARLGGKSLAAALKERNPKLKIIGLSEMSPPQENAQTRVFSAWLPKPFTLTALVAVIEKLHS